MIDDSELLRRYAHDRSEDAFAELVRRHLGFVYGVAVRRTGHDSQLAREVCQEVFTSLAAKAAAVGRQPVLKGWLHTAARFSASRAVRGERRRRVREQEAYIMHELSDNSTLHQDWARLRPDLDEMLGELRERDREAVLLRFFEELTFAQVGQRLKISEDAARVRISRALDEMSRRLARRGIDSTAAVIAGCLGSQAAVAAPTGWTAAITGAAMAGAPAGIWLATFMSVTKTQIGFASVLALAGVSVWRWQSEKQIPPREAPQALAMAPAKMEARSDRRPDPTPVEPARTEVAPAPMPAAAASPPLNPAPVAARLPARAWVNAGRTTPEAAIETLFFAGAKGDLDLIVSGIELGPEFSDRLQLELPVAERGKTHAPERLLAQMLATSSASVLDMQITGRTDVDSDTTRLQVKMANGDRSWQEREFSLRRSADGWRMLVDH